MHQPFPNTLRSVEAERPGAWLAVVLCVALLLLAWAGWFTWARVPLYAVSESGRLEVSDAVHLLQSPVGGQIRAIRAALGQYVRQGEVVIELDAEALRLQLQEERARLSGIDPQLARITRELAAIRQGARDASQGTDTAILETRERIADAEASAALARDEADRARQLFDGGLLPDLELRRVRNELERRTALVARLKLDLERQQSERRAQTSEQTSRAERLQREATVLDAQRATQTAAIERLEHELELRRVRSPIDGRIGELAELHAGEFVVAGHRLASIVPAGQLKAITYFSPSNALGRIREGQPARVRLEGFPWLQYGSVPAVVASVGAEPRDGRLRVELRLTPEPGSPIPFQHGMPGVAEIEIGDVSPALLVLRTTGHWLTGNRFSGADLPAGAGGAP